MMGNIPQSQAGVRIESLLDENSFVEIGGLVTARSTDFNLNSKKAPSDGVKTGYGLINGNPVYVYSQDASVLNGSMGEMHGKKIVKIYELAMKTGAPVIGLIDSTGVRLEEATDALAAFGEIYAVMAKASGVIPQITAVMGNCGGGLALVPAMSDFTFMEEKDGKLFVNAPNTVDGNHVDKCDTSAVDFQSEETGLVDVAASEEEIYGKIRTLVSLLPANNEEIAEEECTDDLNRISADIENAAGDPAVLLADIADNHQFFEVKASYGKNMVTGFIRLDGMTVGVVANRSVRYDEEGNEAEKFDSVLSVRGSKKAAEFVNVCDAFNIPVLSITNVTGYATCKCAEKGIAKAAAQLTYAFANATVPKVNVITEKAYGSAYTAMNSKSLGADIVYAWTDAKIGMMDANSAVKVIYADEIEASDDSAKFIREKAAEYEAENSSVEAAAKRGYVDTVIEPQDTRKYVIGAFEMLMLKREDRPYKKHGTV